MQDLIPMLDYEDGPAALDWLAEAFGFHEVTRLIGEAGGSPLDVHAASVR